MDRNRWYDGEKMAGWTETWGRSRTLKHPNPRDAATDVGLEPNCPKVHKNSIWSIGFRVMGSAQHAMV
jgi:hypothetical protein